MGLVERLNELESMRLSGKISDSEYAMLVGAATKKFNEGPESTKSDATKDVAEIPHPRERSKNLAFNPKLVGIGVVVALVIAFLAFGRGGSTSDSSQSQTQGSVAAEASTGGSAAQKYKGMLINTRRELSDAVQAMAAYQADARIARSPQYANPIIRGIAGACFGLSGSVSYLYGVIPELAFPAIDFLKVTQELRNASQKPNWQANSMDDVKVTLANIEAIWPRFLEAHSKFDQEIAKLLDEMP